MRPLSEMIHKRRAELGLTLLQVAEAAGVSEATAQRWESGSIKALRAGRLEKIAAALHTTPEYLLGMEFSDGQPIHYGRLDEAIVVKLKRAGCDIEPLYDDRASDFEDLANYDNEDDIPGLDEELYQVINGEKRLVFTGATIRCWYAHKRTVANLLKHWPSMHPVLIKRGVRLYVSAESGITESMEEQIVDFIEYQLSKK